MIFSCKDIQKSYGAETVLKSVSFMLEDGEKAALVGVNGAGKTTMFKIITGELAPDSGTLAFKKGASVGYLSQINELAPGNTVYDELLTVFSGVAAIEEGLRRTEKAMGGLSGMELDTLLQKYEKMTLEFENSKGYSYKSLVKGVVSGLGFSEAETQLPLEALSGGQRTRVALGKLLLAEPDLLLLDEPTNHLDIDAVAWLEEYILKTFTGSVLAISHDRYFIDRIASKIIEIEHGETKSYNGNYSSFAYRKELDREQQIKRYVDQQREIKRQEEIIRRYRSYSQEWSVRKAKTREKMLGKVKRLELPSDVHKIRVMLEPRQHSGNDVLHTEGLSMSFSPPANLFSNVGFDMFRGEVAALVGANGVGKTTLFNMLMGRLTGKGLIRFGAGVKIGYYDQEQKLISDEKTVFDEIYDAFPNMTQTEIRTALASFMFCGDDVFKVNGTLSGGEKGRVSLAKLMLGYSNFLLLDEPTNHLDMFSREVLEEAVRNYTGTILYISHDRYFINTTADKIIELSPDGTTTYEGGYDYYLEKKAERAQRPALSESGNVSETAAKIGWQRKKDETSGERRRQSRLDRIEKEINTLEEQIKSLGQRLMEEHVATDPDLAFQVYEEKTALEEKVDILYAEWDELM